MAEKATITRTGTAKRFAQGTAGGSKGASSSTKPTLRPGLRRNPVGKVRKGVK